jgi:Tol biopolymer transport system component
MILSIREFPSLTLKVDKPLKKTLILLIFLLILVKCNRNYYNTDIAGGNIICLAYDDTKSKIILLNDHAKNPIVLYQCLSKRYSLSELKLSASEKWLGFVEKSNDSYALWIMNIASKSVVKIDDNIQLSFGTSAFSWSPVGDKVIYAKDNKRYLTIYDKTEKKTSSDLVNNTIDLSDTITKGIYIYDAETRKKTIVIEHNNHMFHNPDWAPDGMHIAYLISHSYGEVRNIADPESTQIFMDNEPSLFSIKWISNNEILYISSAGLKKIDIKTGTKTNFENGEYIGEIFLSPDHTMNIFNIEGENPTINIYKFKEACINKIAEMKGYHFYWLPNNQQIIFDRQINNKWGIFIIDADGSNLTRIAYNPKLSLAYPLWIH